MDATGRHCCDQDATGLFTVGRAGSQALALALRNQRLLFLFWKPGFHVAIRLVSDRTFFF